jgi:hypothetical protein
MKHARDELTQNLAERWCWQVARRDDTRIARRLYRKQVVDGVYRLDDGAMLDEFLHCLQAVGVMTLLEQAHGAAIPREMVPFVQDVLLDGVKTLLGIARMNALPSVLCSDEALMPLVGFHAPQVRPGICQRGTTTRQGERSPGPMGPDTLAKHIVKWRLQDLEVVLNGSMRALANAGVFDAQVTGMADGTDLETTDHDTGCGQVTRHVRLEGKQGQVHAIEVTVYGWNVLLLIDAATKMPLAVKVGKMHAHEALWTRALVTQARLNLAGAARLPKVIVDQGFLDGSTLWWLNQQGVTCVVPAKAKMAVVVDARAQTVVGEDMAVGCRVHTVRHGQGRTACTERLKTEVVGITGLTTDDQDGTPAHGRQHHRRDFQPHPINAVVVRTWQGQDDGPGGKTVFLTNASVAEPLQAFDDDDDRSRMENCCIKEAKHQWDLGHPPQKSERAVRVHVRCTLVLFALATAYRLPCERKAIGGQPVGWQRWRRQLRAQTRDKVIVCAEGHDGLFHLAEYSRLLGVKLTEIPPAIGSRQQVLAKYRLPAQG